VRWEVRSVRLCAVSSAWAKVGADVAHLHSRRVFNRAFQQKMFLSHPASRSQTCVAVDIGERLLCERWLEGRKVRHQ